MSWRLSSRLRPVILEADLTRLEEVLTDLLDNAAKYTAPLGCAGAKNAAST